VRGRKGAPPASVNAICIPRLPKELPLVSDVVPPVKRSSSSTAGDMKKPPMTSVNMAARRVAHNPRAADASQICRRDKFTPKAADEDETYFALSVLHERVDLSEKNWPTTQFLTSCLTIVYCIQ